MSSQGSELSVPYATIGELYASAIVLPVLGMVSLAMRWQQRGHQRDGIGIDDWLMIPSLLFTIGIGIMMNGSMPGCPQISFGVVDVRDLADLHIRAMTSPEANRQRFIATCDNGPISVIDIANMIRKARPAYSQYLPSKELPNILVRAVALFRPTFRILVPELGVMKRINNEKGKTILGWNPRPVEECIADTADSLIKYGIV